MQGYRTPWPLHSARSQLWRSLTQLQRYRAHSYKNPTDGAEILALFTYNPNTGEAVEIHGSAVSANATENAQLIAEHFSEVPADACELALSTGLSLEHMSQSWSDCSSVSFSALSTASSKQQGRR